MPVELDVSGHQYYLQQGVLQVFQWDGGAPDGLVAVLDDQGRHVPVGYQAVVLTGTEVGAVTASLSVEPRDPGPPSAADRETWDEIVDLSLELGPAGGGLVTDGEDDARSLPPLPAGEVRLRVHARGRDAGAELQVADDPVEEHLILLWPAPPAPRVVHQTRDHTGARLRALGGY